MQSLHQHVKKPQIGIYLHELTEKWLKQIISVRGHVNFLAREWGNQYLSNGTLMAHKGTQKGNKRENTKTLN